MKFIFTMLSLTFMFLLSFSCSKSGTDCENAFKTQIFNLNDSYCLTGSEFFKITLIEDSRCPATLTCFWEGQVKISIQVLKDGITKDTILILPNNNQSIQYVDIFGYDFKISPVQPYPQNEQMIPAHKYRIPMTVIVHN